MDLMNLGMLIRDDEWIKMNLDMLIRDDEWI